MPTLQRAILASITVAGTWLARVEPAAACACCDSITTYTPIGWTDAGGALLIQMRSDAGCEVTAQLEIWHVGAPAPAGCYDLYGDPEQRVECGSSHSSSASPPAHSSRVKQFPRAPVQLDARRVRVSETHVPNAEPLRLTRIAVEVVGRDGPKRVWVGAVESYAGPAHDNDADVIASNAPPPIMISLFPNPRRDRALLRIEYKRPGNGNTDAKLVWVELPPGA
jgi:hypothetical protein